MAQCVRGALFYFLDVRGVWGIVAYSLFIVRWAQICYRRDATWLRILVLINEFFMYIPSCFEWISICFKYYSVYVVLAGQLPLKY